METDLDPPGTCHLVGCAGKGIHLITEPHHLPSDPPSAALPSMLRPKIGCPDSWTPYEGGPTIPKPEPDYCLGFPIIRTTESGAMAHCSIASGRWSVHLTPGALYNAAAMVDEHKRNCANRAKR